MMRNRLQMLAAFTATALLLSGCGSSDEPADVAKPSAGTPATTPTQTAEPTPTATTAKPTSTTSATPPAPPQPSGKLIDYETGDEDGATITVAADTAKLTGAPADFKTFIARELSKKPSVDASCTEAPQIYVSRLDTGGWARGGAFIPQCGGYATLWAKTRAGWVEAWSGQSLVDCDTLDRHDFPVRVAGDSCLKGDDAVAYSG